MNTQSGQKGQQGQSQWASLKNKMRQQWGKLSDSDFDSVEKNPEDVIGRLQRSYGYTKDQARDEFERFKDRNSNLFASDISREARDRDESEDSFEDEETTRGVRDDNDPASVDPSTNERRQ